MSLKASRYKEKVWLYVYDLNPQNEMTRKIGVGAYHSGVVVHGKEHTFGQGGMMTHPPGEAGQGQPGCKFREKVLLGTTTKNSRDVQIDFDSLRPYFKGEDYNVMKRNCNHFSDSFSKKVFQTNKSVMPKWVNRTAGIGSFFSSFLPGGEGKEYKEPEIKEGFKTFQGEGFTLREAEEGGGGAVKKKKKKQPKKRSWLANWWYGGDDSNKNKSGDNKKSKSLKKKKKKKSGSVKDEEEEEITRSPVDDRDRILQATLARLGQSGSGKN